MARSLATPRNLTTSISAQAKTLIGMTRWLGTSTTTKTALSAVQKLAQNMLQQLSFKRAQSSELQSH